MKTLKLTGRVPAYLDVFEVQSEWSVEADDPTATHLARREFDVYPSDKIVGTPGDDSLTGTDGNDTMHGGKGNDTIDGGGNGGFGGDTIYGGEGNDQITIHSQGFFWIGAGAHGGSGDDTVAGWGNLYGGSGNDKLVAEDDAWLYGGMGNDSLYGSDGDDYLFCGTGKDWAEAGAGDDYVQLSSGRGRTVDGGAGSDRVHIDRSNAEDDIVWVHDAAKTKLFGNTITGFESLSLSTGSGDDVLEIDKGWSAGFYGGGGNDTLIGGAQTDWLSGEDGDDLLEAEDGGDHMYGGDGDDTLDGGAGRDTLEGDKGADVFVLGDGKDLIWDFDEGLDKSAISQSAFSVGDGDTEVEGATTISGPGGFAASAELVVNTQEVGRRINAEIAAAAMGSAGDSYTLGQTAIFVVRSDDLTAVYGFESAGTDALVSAGELTLLCEVLRARDGTTTDDYLFVG